MPLAPLTFLALSLMVCLFGACAGFGLSSRPVWSHWVAYVSGAFTSLLALLGATSALWGGRVMTLRLLELPPLGALTIRLDALSEIFLGLIGFVGLSVSIYALGYARPYVGRKHVGALGALFNLALAAMALVVLADNAIGFLMAWEIMALVSFLLVVYEHERPLAIRSAVFYAIMTHIGTGLLLVAFMLLATHAHGFSFDTLRQSASTLSPASRNLAFLGILFGFGAKAGLPPFQGWLPRAYGVAPTHVAALMSAAMINTGLYGILRFVFDILGTGAPWWGVFMLVMGILAALLGAIYAVVEGDFKQMLAYSSIENVGIIMVGLGAALLFKAYALAPLAALALIAALYHTVNHACFKGLMFCSAGAVQRATGTTQLDQLGGLIRPMPVTAALCLVGTLALASLPPFNGFVSEWLSYQALFQGLYSGALLLKLLLPLAAAALALTSGLVLVAFVKAYAVGFLAKPRTDAAQAAFEVEKFMQAGTGIFALACLALGILPGLVVPVLGRVAGELLGASVPASRAYSLAPGTLLYASLSLPALMLALLVLVPGVLGLARALGGKTGVRQAPAWGCGITLTARTQYSAQGYAQPLRTLFGKFLLPHAREVQVDPTVAPYFKRNMRYSLFFESLVDKTIYRPLIRGVLAFSRKVTHLIQGGSIHVYLAYIFIALIAVLLAMRGLG
jgi:hydrogenase-4 component B